MIAFVFGEGGWVECRFGESGPPPVHVRFAEEETGRLRVVELYLSTARASGPPPPWATSKRGSRASNPAGITTDAIRALPIGQIEVVANSPDTARELRSAISRGSDAVEDATDAFLAVISPLRKVKAPRQPKPKLRLTVPDVTRKPDAFYNQVAEAYGYLGRRSKQPAAELAAANDVPVNVVYQWIKEARRRGLMAPRRARKDG